MLIAILDFGTNTFNLLIAETDDPAGLKYLHSSKEPVKLGEGGINNRILTPEAMKRGIKALENHYITIREFGAKKIYAFATSAVRDAQNSRDFLQMVQEKFELFVNIIPGDREAELIYKGVRQACGFDQDKVLIVDIGGGSNECIIADKQRIYWKESFNLGMARLLEKFNPESPITKNTTEKVEAYFENNLTSLFEAIDRHKPAIMVGASGSYETFYALLKHRLPEKYQENGKAMKKEIFLEDFRGLHHILLKSTHEERKNMPGMEPVRVDMIVLASIFVNFILKKHHFDQMMMSEYALKEGVIAEIFNI